jgi:hypothetical protein
MNPTMKTEPCLPRLVALLVLFPFAAVAQPPPSAVFRPALLELSAGNYSYSTKADVSHGVVLGSVAVHHAEVSLSGRHEIAADLQLAYGLDYDTNRLIADAGVPLPDQLTALSLNLGLIRTFNPKWTAAVFARPGFYGDFSQLGRRSLNAPLLVSASYNPRPELDWTFALAVDPFAKNPVLPVLGVHRAFASGWDIALGFPRTGITWQMTDDIALRADASFQGGSYRVMAAPAAVPALAGSLADYREIRTGLGMDCKVGAAGTLSLDVGLVADRRFDYHQRGYRLDGASAAYLKLALVVRR